MHFKEKKNVLLLPICYIYQDIFYPIIIPQAKCYSSQNVTRQNVTQAKCYPGKMLLYAKCYPGKMLLGKMLLQAKCYQAKCYSRQNVTQAKCYPGKMLLGKMLPRQKCYSGKTQLSQPEGLGLCTRPGILYIWDIRTVLIVDSNLII